uniref:Uncharacterized protein n=1 Tax=Avena sativa TaxID=4498 RepID=A0ACD5ZQD4_AVESA
MCSYKQELAGRQTRAFPRLKIRKHAGTPNCCCQLVAISHLVVSSFLIYQNLDLALLAPSEAMESKRAVHMNQGQGDTSYALNSSYQNAEQNRMKPLIEAAIVELCSDNNTLLHGKMVIADLGCSSGPNALALVSTAVKAIHNHFLRLQQSPLEVCVLLNDLPENDFNTMAKILVTLRQSHEPVVVTGITPGSFYERLFMSGSVHLVCSSFSLHWLSKACMKGNPWCTRLMHNSSGKISQISWS